MLIDSSEMKAAPPQNESGDASPHSKLTRVSQCSAGSHKPRRPGATPGPATWPGTQIWKSGQVESLTCVGSSPTLVNPMKSVPSSNGNDAWPTPRRRWFDSIRDHSLLNVAQQRTTNWACRSMEGCLPCKQAIRVRFPVGPLRDLRFQI